MRHEIEKSGKRIIIHGWLNREIAYTEAAEKLLAHLPFAPDEQNRFMECIKDQFITGASKDICGHISTSSELFYRNSRKYLAMLKRLMKTKIKNQVQVIADTVLKEKNPEQILTEVPDNFIIDVRCTSPSKADSMIIQKLLKQRHSVTAKEIKEYALRNRYILKLFRYTIIRHGEFCQTQKRA